MFGNGCRFAPQSHVLAASAALRGTAYVAIHSRGSCKGEGTNADSRTAAQHQNMELGEWLGMARMRISIKYNVTFKYLVFSVHTFMLLSPLRFFNSLRMLHHFFNTENSLSLQIGQKH